MKKTNKWYLKKGTFEKYEINPFVEKAIETIAENRVVKKQFMRGDKAITSRVINDDGEITGQSMFVRMVEVDEDKFAKLYLNELGILWDMQKPALKLFSFVLTALTPNNDQFYFSMTKAMGYTGYKTTTAVNNAISQLLALGVLAKTIEDNWYFINPLFIFNGSRVTFAKTYVKKNKIITNPNQISLLDQPGVVDNSDFLNETTE